MKFTKKILILLLPATFNFYCTSPGINPGLKKESKNRVTISLVGDILMGSYIGNYIDKFGVDYPWQDVAPFFKSSDYSVANLETSVSLRGQTKKPVGYGFRSNPQTIEGLVNNGINTVNLANNHILDFGPTAFEDTLKYLSKNKIGYFGAGKNMAEATRPLIVRKNGISIAFIGFSAIIPEEQWKATSRRPGVAALSQKTLKQISETVKKLSGQVDLLFVVFHWGTELHVKPDRWQISTAHLMIDSGAAGVIGHHPHVLQGIEFYKNRPIFYSLGNFVFLVANEEASQTGIVQMTVNKRGFQKAFFYPVWIQYCKANLLKSDGAKGAKIISNLRQRSEPFGVSVTAAGEIIPPARK